LPSGTRLAADVKAPLGEQLDHSALSEEFLCRSGREARPALSGRNIPRHPARACDLRAVPDRQVRSNAALPIDGDKISHVVEPAIPACAATTQFWPMTTLWAI